MPAAPKTLARLERAGLCRKQHSEQAKRPKTGFCLRSLGERMNATISTSDVGIDSVENTALIQFEMNRT